MRQDAEDQDEPNLFHPLNKLLHERGHFFHTLHHEAMPLLLVDLRHP